MNGVEDAWNDQWLKSGGSEQASGMNGPKRGHEVVGRWLDRISFILGCFWHQHGGLWEEEKLEMERPARWLGQVPAT